MFIHSPTKDKPGALYSLWQVPPITRFFAQRVLAISQML